MRRFIPLAITFVLLAVLVASAAHRTDAAIAQEQTLFADASVTYDVRPDAGPVTVTWYVELKNNDPQTVYQESGLIYYYYNYTIPVLRGATAISAFGPSGGVLSVSLEDEEEGPVLGATVRFDRDLFYGQSYSFALSYELPEARSDALLVTPYYVFLPAVGGGDVSSVTVEVPDDSAWETTLEPVECTESGPAEYECQMSDYLPVAALVEVSKPDALESIEGAVSLAEGDIALSVKYFPGERDWAERILDLATTALPILEDLFGVAYGGPAEIEIAERGRQGLFGYEGTYGCQSDDDCSIGIHPMGEDIVALHEFAHSWTRVFEERWIQEGLAEYMALQAAERLEPPVAVVEREPIDSTIELQLDVWRKPIIMVNAPDEEKDREHTGYAKSLRFIQVLVEAAGMEALQAVNLAAAERPEIDQPRYLEMNSRQYLDALEDASRVRLDDQFLEWVFLPGTASILEERRPARERLEELHDAFDQAGISLPFRIDRLVQSWKFGPAQDAMDEADEALAAYGEAVERLDQPRSVFQRIGLLNKDPDALLVEAVSDFERGDLDGAAGGAREAQGMVDEAGRVGLYRLLAGAAMLLAVVVASGGAIWFVRRRRGASR